MPWYKKQPASDELNAVIWAASQANMSYGCFMEQTTPEIRAEALKEYRALKQRRREQENARLSKSGR